MFFNCFCIACWTHPHLFLYIQFLFYSIHSWFTKLISNFWLAFRYSLKCIHINKTWTLLQTTGGKDEQNIVCMRKSQHGTQNVKSHNRRTQTTKKMNNKEYLLILIGIWLLYSIKLRPTWIHFREYRKANQKLEINFVNQECFE
jgi:hypothetical protein